MNIDITSYPNKDALSDASKDAAIDDSSQKDVFYVTTPIYYVNDVPHILSLIHISEPTRPY